jgi:hypothetical protein
VLGRFAPEAVDDAGTGARGRADRDVHGKAEREMYDEADRETHGKAEREMYDEADRETQGEAHRGMNAESA